MKYCKDCGVLYSDLLGACPKCGAALEDSAPEAPIDAPRAVKVRQWAALVIGIPLFVGVLYIVIRFLYALAG